MRRHEKVTYGELVANGEGEFVDQFACMRRDNRSTEQYAFFVRDELDKSGALICHIASGCEGQGRGGTVCTEIAARAIIFGQSDAGYFGECSGNAERYVGLDARELRM